MLMPMVSPPKPVLDPDQEVAVQLLRVERVKGVLGRNIASKAKMAHRGRWTRGCADQIREGSRGGR